LDLGLISTDDGTITISNPIYREVIARHLTYQTHFMIPKATWPW
jgi:hypothetical protein